MPRCCLNTDLKYNANIFKYVKTNPTFDLFGSVKCHIATHVDVDVDVEDLRAQANASMPASYIAN